MSKELKYKVGDTVIIVAKIDRVDADDDAMSYREGAHGMWFGESNIIGKLPEPEPKAEPEKRDTALTFDILRHFAGSLNASMLGGQVVKPKPKYQVGDPVRHSHYGKGEVVGYLKLDDDDSSPYQVKFASARKWFSESELTPA